MKNFEKKEVATDMEMALLLIKHIENPCEDLHGNNLRDFYIRDAKRALTTFHDPDAEQLLMNVIKKYSE